MIGTVLPNHHTFSQVTDDGVASLQAEQEVLSHARTAVLRVPRCLYGPVEDLQESPVTGGVLVIVKFDWIPILCWWVLVVG